MNPLLCKKKSIFYEVYDIHGVEYKFQGVNVIEKSKNILTVFKINSKNSLYFGGRATLFLLTYECLFNSLHIKFSFPTNKKRRGTAPLLQSSRAAQIQSLLPAVNLNSYRIYLRLLSREARLRPSTCELFTEKIKITKHVKCSSVSSMAMVIILK